MSYILKVLQDRIVDIPLERKALEVEISGIQDAVSKYTAAYNALTGSVTKSQNGFTTGTIPAQDALFSGLNSGLAILLSDSQTSISGVLDTGNALPANVLSGYSFSTSGQSNIVGTMQNNGAVFIVPSASNQFIPTGYHNGSGIVSGDSHLTAANIKSGIVIFGITGVAP